MSVGGPVRPLPQWVHARATATPDQVALTAVGDGSVTWLQLWCRGRAWGDWLAGHGVGPGDRVITLVPQSLAAAYVWLGCSTLGAVEVSVNAEYRGEWLRHALDVSGAAVAVVAAKYLEPLRRVLERTPITTVLVYDAGAQGADGTQAADGWEGSAGVVLASAPSDVDAEVDPGPTPTTLLSDLSCVLFTSGTTGASKAVEVPWRQLYGQVTTEPTPTAGPEEVYYVPYAPYHLSGRGALYRGAITGGHTVVRESFSTGEFWADIRRFGCTWTLLYAAPSRFVLGRPVAPDDADNPLRRVLMCPLLPEVDEVKQRFGVEVFTVYGMTEIGNPLMLGPAECDSAHAGCCGRPVDGVEARLVDAHDYPVAPGTPGELVVRSAEPWLFTSGYQGNPEATARAWRNGWFHTGDVCTRDADGVYRYVDRAKDMIRRRGENISSVELEAAIGTHPAVAEVAALGIASELGDEDVLVAVVPRPGAWLDPGELFDYLRDNVPRFALPRFVRVLPSLPRTQATQRVQKHALRAEGVPAGTWDHRADD